MYDFNKEIQDLVVDRSEVLSVLAATPLDKPALSGDLSVSRSTVDRAVRELETFDLVSRRDGSYVVSAGGRVVHRAYEEFEEQLEAVTALFPLLEHLDREDGIDPVVLRDADCYLEDAAPPNDVSTAMEPLLERVEEIEGMTRVISTARSADRYHDAVSRGVTFTNVYAIDLASFLNAWGSEQRQEMIATGNYHPFVTERDLAYTMHIYHLPDRSVVCLFVYDGDDELVGLIQNDSGPAVEWARATFEEYLADAFDITDQF